MLGSPVGSFVYHLLILLAVEAALGMALEERHTRGEQARRFLLAMVGLTAVRLTYAIAALVAGSNWIPSLTLLPPLERVADTVSICLLGWAFLPPGRRGVRFWECAFGANLALAVAVGVGFTILWNGALLDQAALNYNTYWQSTAWSAWQMVLVALVSLAAVRYQRESVSVLLAAMLFMFVGRLLQIANPTVVSNLPTLERLSNLLAFPLITVAIYQNILAGLRAHTHQLEDISQASLDQIKSLLLLSEASRQISASLDLPTVLDKAVRGLARALDADQCAVALPENGDPGYMRLAAIYDPTRQGRSEAPTFPLEYQPAVQQAIRRKKSIAVEESENVQLRVLFSLMGSNETGPLLVQPLLLEGEAIGALLVGNSRSRRPFTSHETKLCQSIAEHVVGAIRNAQQYLALTQDKAKELHRSRDERYHGLQPANTQVQDLPGGVSAQADTTIPNSTGNSLRRTG